MKVLGIESSCDETAMAVIEVAPQSEIENENVNVRVLSNVVSSQVKLHAPYGGVVPNLAAREHVKNIDHVFELALNPVRSSLAEVRRTRAEGTSETSNGIKEAMDQIDLIAVTHGPGLGPALIIGISFAKTLAWLHKKPLIGVNHMEGHIYSNWLNPNENLKPIFPALNLIVSGGHTELVLMPDHNQYQLVGETKDDAVGEAFDKVARLLDLGYPGGPIISKLAEEGNSSRFPLPSPMAHSKDFNFSYSGLKTAVLYLTRDLGKENIDEQTKKDIAASFQKAAVSVLIEKTIAAAKQYDAKSVLLSGGVSANKLLRTELQKAAEKNSLLYFQPEMKYTTDNAVMIAMAGYFNFTKNKKTAGEWQSVRMDANLSF